MQHEPMARTFSGSSRRRSCVVRTLVLLRLRVALVRVLNLELVCLDCFCPMSLALAICLCAILRTRVILEVVRVLTGFFLFFR